MLSAGSQASRKSVTQKGSVVSVSSADAHKSKRSEDPKGQTRKSVSSTDSQKPETSKKREHIESEQWTKVSYQNRPKFERYIPKKNTVGVSRAGKVKAQQTKIDHVQPQERLLPREVETHALRKAARLLLPV